jgi:type VII secretion integral membrane protein EccD
LSVPDPGLRRVSIHSGSAVVDVALPSQLTVATLIPPIVDIVEGRDTGGQDDLTARRYQLSRPGTSALRRSTTLAQNGIRDGEVLVLSHSRAPVAPPRYDDAAEAICATLDARGGSPPPGHHATRLTGAVAAGGLTVIGTLALVRDSFDANVSRHIDATAGAAGLVSLVALMFATYAHRTYRDPLAGITLGAIATTFGALAGFLAVPGRPAFPHVLLAAMAAVVMSVLAMRLSGCGVVAFTAVSCCALLTAIAALTAVETGAPLRAISSVSALVSLGLLGAAPRLSIIFAGLSPRLTTAQEFDVVDAPADDWSARAIQADAWLASLLAAFSSAAAAGAISTLVAGAPRLNSIAFAAMTAALLLLRANSAERRTLVCVISGIVTIGTTLGVATVGIPRHGPWIVAATAMMVALAVCSGFVAPAISASPVVRRCIELLECLALVAMVPLTCWVCGAYGNVSGLYSTRV